MAIDLNCDMGESFGAYTLGLDEQVIPLITSANIACGFHAGDPTVMRRTVDLAARHGVSVGAHVSFPDLVGFGRREIHLSPDELEADILYQIGALAAFCRVAGVSVRHVKPHGALYNMAQRDPAVAQTVARAVAAFDPRLLLFAQSGSALEQAGAAAGLRVVREAFADRAYTAEGRLASRHLPGSVIHDAALVADRALAMVTHRKVTAIDGTEIDLCVETICVHGDTPGAVKLIERIRQRLVAHGITVLPIQTI